MNPLKHVAIIMDGNGRWGLKKKKRQKLWSQKRACSCRENYKRNN